MIVHFFFYFKASGKSAGILTYNTGRHTMSDNLELRGKKSFQSSLLNIFFVNRFTFMILKVVTSFHLNMSTAKFFPSSGM